MFAFLFSSKNTFFMQIWSKLLKLFETWLIMCFSFVLDQIYYFWENCYHILEKYKISFKLFGLIVVSFGFFKLVKIPENVSVLQSFFLINNTE